MFKIDNATAATVIPTPGSVGPNPNSFFTEGDPGLGVPATIVTADWLNAVQEEISYVITQQGITLSKSDRTQLKKAIDYMLLNSAANSATASGTNTYTVTLTPAPTAYSTWMEFKIKFTNANTSSSTLNVNSLGAKTIKRANGAGLNVGDIIAGMIGHLIYDGTDMILLNPASPLGAYVDGNGVVVGSSDSTKILRFEVDGFSTSTTRVWTPPNYDLNFAHGAFFAYNNNAQNISHATNTKVQMDAESFDSNSWYDTSNYRWTPLVPGIVVLGGTVRIGDLNSSGHCRAMVYKNGSSYAQKESRVEASSLSIMPIVITVGQTNGSTDYWEFWTVHQAATGGGTEQTVTGSTVTNFWGYHIPSS